MGRNERRFQALALATTGKGYDGGNGISGGMAGAAWGMPARMLLAGAGAGTGTGAATGAGITGWGTGCGAGMGAFRLGNPGAPLNARFMGEGTALRVPRGPFGAAAGGGSPAPSAANPTQPN